MSIWDASAWSETYREPLSAEDITELSAALEDWAREHPLQNRPLLYIDQLTSVAPRSRPGLTPTDLADALRDPDSSLHEPVLRLFEVGLSGFKDGPRNALEQVIAALYDDVSEWKAKGG